MFFPMRSYKFVCDDCLKDDFFATPKYAREAGWAVSKDYRKCYCPSCAPARRNVGCKGGRRRSPFTAVNGENRN